MTASVRGVGSLVGGLGDIVVTLPTHVAGDMLMIFAACDTDTVAAPAGWTVKGKAFLTGTLITCMVRDTYAASGAESSPTIADPGNHCAAVALSIQDGDINLHRIAGCSTAGSGTIGRTPSIETEKDDCLMLFAIACGLDSASAFSSAVANADVTGIAEIFDAGTDEGNGSGIAIASATLAAPGWIRQTEFTITAANTAGLTIAIMPKPIVLYAGVAVGAPNGADVIRIVDVTAEDVPFLASVTGGAGAYSGLVRYADHDYVPIYDDGSERGAGGASVA